MDDDAKYAIRSVQALCFFCFAIGLVVAPLVGKAVSSIQFQMWSDFLVWSAVLEFADRNAVLRRVAAFAHGDAPELTGLFTAGYLYQV